MISFTDRAREVVRSFLDQSAGELEALRISSSRTDGSQTGRFELTLVAKSEQRSDETALESEDFPVFVRESDGERLEGATVDFVDRVNESGFEVSTVGGTPAEAAPRKVGVPSGEIADRVRSVLDSQVNPAIAAHGGVINLIDVQESEIYVEMSGGCQGCALSRMTLRQGVERMLREKIPELTAVHDVTDHASGENPYFQH